MSEFVSQAQIKAYRSSLNACMNYSFDTNHPKEYQFIQEELLELTPEHIYKYFAFKVYGIPDPTENSQPTLGRSTTLEYF
jgi:hypothetical protein